jgi:hypothetical protein
MGLYENVCIYTSNMKNYAQMSLPLIFRNGYTLFGGCFRYFTRRSNLPRRSRKTNNNNRQKRKENSADITTRHHILPSLRTRFHLGDMEHILANILCNNAELTAIETLNDFSFFFQYVVRLFPFAKNKLQTKRFHYCLCVYTEARVCISSATTW